MKYIKYIIISLLAIQFNFVFCQTELSIKSSTPTHLDEFLASPANVIPSRSLNANFIENITISNNLEGAVPMDIIFLPTYNKFYVYGKRRILVVDALTKTITKSIDISDHSQTQPVVMNNATNRTNKEEHLVLANINGQEYVYCATESLEIIKINPADDSWTTVVNTPSTLLVDNFYSNMKLKFDSRTNRIYWMIAMDTHGGSIFIYNISGTNLSFVNQIDITNSGLLIDIAVNQVLDEFYVNAGIQLRKYNSINFNYTILANTNNQRGDLLYINEGGHHKLYSFARDWQHNNTLIYQIDFNNNNNLTSFNSPLPTETACYYNSVTDEIYIAFDRFSHLQNDIFIMNPSTNNVLTSFNTHIYSDNYENNDISFHRFNGNVILCKTHELIQIDELNYNFSALEIAQYNMYLKCATSNSNAFVISPWSGNINVIGSDLTINSKIDVGASLYFGCFNPDKSKAYLYHTGFQGKSKVYILNTLTNQISHLEMGNNISDMFVYAPDENTNRVYVSFYDETNLVKAIDGETDQITGAQYWISLNENYCGSMFLAPNNKLYCMNGLDNQGNHDAGIEIRDAANGFAYLGSHYYTDMYGALTGKFCYNANNNMVYATVMDLNGFPDYGKLTEIDGNTNTATDFAINNTPNNIVVNKINNNVYIQHEGNQQNITVYSPKNHSISLVNIGYPVWDIQFDETRNMVFVLYHKANSQALGFIDNLSFASGVDLPYSTSSIKFNPYNSSIYAYVPHNHWSPIPEESELWQCTMDSYVNINNYNITTQRISLHNWHTFKYNGFIFSNDIILDKAQNRIFVANGGHSNISAVSYQPEDYLYLQPRVTWLSIPRHTRTVDPETSLTSDVFAQNNMSVPFSDMVLDYNNIDKSMAAGSRNIVSAYYSSTNWSYDDQIMNYIDSRRGYVLHDILPTSERLLKLEGTQEDPGSYIDLYCKKENWIGYFLEEEQNVFDALADIEPDIYHIQLQYVNCYRYNYPVSNDCNQTKSTSDYSPGTWICNGTPNIKYGDMVKVTPIGDITNFQWNYSGNPPSGAIRPKVVYYTFEEKPSYETFVLVLDSTTSNPTEIGAFVNDTCVGACSVTAEDSVVVLSAYTNGTPGDSVTFEQHFGSQKNSNIRLNSYLVKNRLNNLFEKRVVKTGEKQDAFIINFNAKNTSIINNNFNEKVKIYPNPVTDNLNYSLILEKDSKVQMTLFDINGRKMGTLVNKKFDKGYYSASINIKNLFENKLKEGIYLIKITIDNNSFNKKLIIK